nr:GrpB family protein [Chloroflexota bacterium]
DALSRYAAVKHGLAERYGDDRLGYTEGKTPFIRNALRKAEDWARQTGWTVDRA